jgi:hypothetical protein
MIADAVNVAGTELNLRPASLGHAVAATRQLPSVPNQFYAILDQAGHERAVVNRDESL